MSFSLFNLQREHYTIETTERASTVYLENPAGAKVLRYELCFGHQIEPYSSTFTGTSPEDAYAAWITEWLSKIRAVKTVVSEKIPAWGINAKEEFDLEITIADWNSLEKSDIPEDLFVSINAQKSVNAYGEQTTLYNSVIVDCETQKVYLKKAVQSYTFTGNEPQEWWYSNSGPAGPESGWVFCPPKASLPLKAGPRNDGTNYSTHFPAWSEVPDDGWVNKVWIDLSTFSPSESGQGFINFMNAQAAWQAYGYSTGDSYAFRAFLAEQYRNGTPVKVYWASNYTEDDIDGLVEEVIMGSPYDSYDPNRQVELKTWCEEITESYPKFSQFLLSGILPELESGLNKPFQTSSTVGNSAFHLVAGTQETGLYPTAIKLTYMKQR